MFRAIGFLCMMVGIGWLFSPIIYIVSWIPLIGWLMAHGIALVVWIFAFIAALTFSSLTIGLAWLYYRPLYGVLLLLPVAVGLGLIFLV